MHMIEIESASGRSSIFIGDRLNNLPNHLPPGRAIVITDDNLLRLYRSELPSLPVLSIGFGESV